MPEPSDDAGNSPTMNASLQGIVSLDGPLVGPRRVVTRLNRVDEPAYSLCIMVTDPAQFAQMVTSFTAGGFGLDCCEYLICDNTGGNRADAYVAANEFLQVARAPRILLCHQDIVLLDDGRTRLDEALDELDRIDPAWAVAGNAGMCENGWPVTCLSEPNLPRNVYGGPLPHRIVSLDENFLVVRRIANLALSRDLGGFHHYGSDLCLIADVLGWNSYVIDFLLRHNSPGNPDHRFHASAAAFEAKYARAFRPRWLHSIINRPLFISGRARNRLDVLRRSWAKLTGKVARNRDLWSEARFSASQRHLAAMAHVED